MNKWTCILRTFVILLLSASAAEAQLRPASDSARQQLAPFAESLRGFLAREEARGKGAGINANGMNIRTDAVLVIRGDEILFEEYFNGYGPDMRHRVWSIGKSITNSFLAMAVKEGRVSLSDSLCKYFATPELSAPSRFDHCSITIENIARWSSGLDWSETYTVFSPRKSSIVAMLYGEGRADMPAFTWAHDFRGASGDTFTYSSGDTSLIWGILRKVYTPEEYENLPWAKLFDPLGMQSVAVSRDEAGNFLGASHFLMSPRDLAKFGRFILGGGNLVGGDTFFPAGWSEWMRTLSPAFLAQQPAGSDKLDTPAGAQWWLNIAVPQARIAKPWPSGPDDMFVGLGVFGQTLFLIPSKNAIVIRLSHDLVGGFDRDGLLREAMAIIDAKPPETLANQAPELVVEQEFQDLESLKRTYDGTSFSQLLANYFAKELCTCLFQIGQSEEVCRSDVKYTSLAIRYEILGDTKEVATRNFSARARAKLVDDRSGCKIIEPAI